MLVSFFSVAVWNFYFFLLKPKSDSRTRTWTQPGPVLNCGYGTLWDLWVIGLTPEPFVGLFRDSSSGSCLGSSVLNRTFLQNFQVGPNQTLCLQKPTFLSTVERLCYCITHHETLEWEITFLPLSTKSLNVSVLEAEPEEVQFVLDIRLILLKRWAGLQLQSGSCCSAHQSCDPIHLVHTWSNPGLVLDCSALKTQFLFKTFAFFNLCTNTSVFVCII